MPRLALGSLIILVLLAAAGVAFLSLWRTDVPLAPTPDETTNGAVSPESGPTSLVQDTVEADHRAVSQAADAVITAATDVERAAVADASGSPLMRLRVVDADEQPLVATVTVSPHTDENAVKDAPPRSVITTGDDGWCTLPVAATGRDTSVLLRVEADGRHRQSFWQRRPELTVKLPWVGPLPGRVVDAETGAAIAGAQVRRPHHGCKGCEPDTATTAADGSFALERIPRNEDCSFAVTAAGYPQQDFGLRVPGKGEPVENVFRLRRGVLVTGRCIDLDTKAPLAGATLKGRGHAGSQTAPGGRFEALLLPPEDPTAPLSVELVRDGYCRCVFRVEQQATADLELPLVAALSVRGVVCTPAGTPIEGARVSADMNELTDVAGLPPKTRVSTGRNNDGPVKTDAQGRFSLDGLPPRSKGRIRASHNDYQSSPEQRWGLEHEVTSEAAPVRIVLQPKAPLGDIGTIVGTFAMNGIPSVGSVRWKGVAREGYGEADDQGRFRIEKVQAGEVALEVVPEVFRWSDQDVRDRFTARQTVTVPANAEVAVHVQLAAPMATVAGTVRFDDGSPAPNRTVYVSKPSTQLRATTDAGGTYTLLVPASFESLTISAAGDPKARDVAPGATGIDFVVPRQGTLRYRARRDDGRATGIQFAVRRDGETWMRQLEQWRAPDPEGYRAEDLPQGRYTVVVSAADSVPVVHHVQVAEQALLDVVLALGTTITVRLAEGSAPLPEGCSISLLDQTLEREDVSNTGYMFGESTTRRRVRDLVDDNTLRGIGPGRHRLVTNRKQIVLEPDHVEVGTEPVTLTLRWREAK